MSEWQAVMRSGAIIIRRRANSTPNVAGPTLLQSVGDQARSAWSWLEHKRLAHVSSRRLHVAETLSLGEKRFVSILEVDGTQYLIGGSAGNVQLLTKLESLDPATPPHESTRQAVS